MGARRKIKKGLGRVPALPIPPQPQGQGGRMDVDQSELEAILERAKTTPMSEAEYAKVHAAVETLVFLTQELEKKRVSIQRLKHLLFGTTTESTRKVLAKILGNAGKDPESGEDVAPESETQTQEKAPGHGRHAAADYVGGQKVWVPHESLQPGDACPKCQKGTVYERETPGQLVRIRGQAPLGATVYELQKLRCNLCGTTFTAQPPPGVGPEKDKYDAQAASMIALLKYGTGLPFNRLEGLEGSLGIPLPAATQWGIVAHSSHQLEPALDELTRQAAQGEIFHNDDTGAKVLALMGRRRDPLDDDLPDLPNRTGVFTSGLVSIRGGHRIALFVTGRRHAGENLAALLRQRAAELGPPIQMCDALSRNVPDLPEELQTILANCLTHGRRQFVDVAMNFPEECLYVLLILKDVYTNDALTKEQAMSPEQRLAFHQEHSRPKMEELKIWLAAQLEQKNVEPNSGLGKAILYMRKHWNELTLFLRQPGAPLDNNVCERALKKAILHRKNAYFYKTENGAHIGDLFMSLIHTCELNGVNPLDYLTQLLKHAEELAAHPADWMPWNYRDTLQKLAASRNS
jgi:transposase